MGLSELYCIINWANPPNFIRGVPSIANAIGIMDQGFAELKFINIRLEKNKYFILRISNNWKLEFD